MTAPKRIQRRRAKGWRMPDGAVYVGRPTKWGNPYRGPDAAQLFATELRDCQARPYDDAYPIEIRTIAEEVHKLAGYDLACWCPLDQPCHADVLLEIANAEVPHDVGDHPARRHLHLGALRPPARPHRHPLLRRPPDPRGRPMSAIHTLLKLGSVDVYPVGFRRDIGRAWIAARLGDWGEVRHRIRYVRRDWRRRSYWNGWLAEPYHLPPGMTRVGRGWTRVGALRSLARVARKEGRIDTEASR